MFYRDPELFVKQAVVDRYVDDLAYTLGVERGALNVVCFHRTSDLPSILTMHRSLLLKALLRDLSR
jgi:hypothetical protein